MAILSLVKISWPDNSIGIILKSALKIPKLTYIYKKNAMGKPFVQELIKINETFKWALETPLDNEAINDFLRGNLIVVGSGGSTSACVFLNLMQLDSGYLSTALTPLDFQYAKNAIGKDCKVVLISASGKNSDILFAFDTALKYEPKNIISICLQTGTPLYKKSIKYSIAKVFEFNNPAGKDGFLATNSLIVYFVLIKRIFNKTIRLEKLVPSQNFLTETEKFCKVLDSNFTLTVLYGGWGKPVAVDLESKFSESGLGNVLLSDFRNFGHGRHNWFDKKKKESAIVALITPEEYHLAERTLNLLPTTIPILKIKSDFEGCNASLDLLYQSFYLVSAIGQIKKIDPGRPGVPSYGSALYNLKYANYYQDDSIINSKIYNAINRKLDGINRVGKSTILPFWIEAYNKFITKLYQTKFRGIMLDYDGTLCAHNERFSLLREDIIKYLIYFIEQNLVIGIVTGRGKSVRENLQKQIPQKFWANLIIGYYNGSQIGTLEDNEIPVKETKDPLFTEIFQILSNLPLATNFSKFELREGQLTLQINDKNNGTIIKNSLIDLLRNKYSSQIQILESSHSIDIISARTSKTQIIDYCMKLVAKESDCKFLCIGDRGKYPGNDYQLLSTEYSLSVDQVSNDPNTCWNLSSVGKNCVETTIEYFSAIKPIKDGFFKIKI